VLIEVPNIRHEITESTRQNPCRLIHCFNNSAQEAKIFGYYIWY